MNMLKKWDWLILGIILMGFIQLPCTALQSQTSRQILESVKKHYQSHNKLELKAKTSIHINIKSEVMSRHRTVHNSLYFASASPGKIRLESKGKKGRGLTISDGNTVWHYLSQLNEYTKKKYAIMQTGITNLGKEFKALNLRNNFIRNVPRAFNPLTDSIEKILSLGRDTLIMPDSSRRIASKINVTYLQDSSALSKGIKKLKKNPIFSIKNIKRFPTTFWIDPKSDMVLRESFGGSVEMVPRQKKTMVVQFEFRNDIYYTSVDLHPTLADSLFVFQPPKGTKKVKRLNALNILKRKPHHHKKASAMTDKQAPYFTLSSFSGKSMNLKDLRGKVVVLDFWATWCGPCRKELPHLQSLYQQFKGKDVVILGINNEKRKKVTSFLKKNNYTFTNLYDPGQKTADKYHVLVVPSVFIIDKKGSVSAYLAGYHSLSTLRKAIKKVRTGNPHLQAQQDATNKSQHLLTQKNQASRRVLQAVKRHYHNHNILEVHADLLANANILTNAEMVKTHHKIRHHKSHHKNDFSIYFACNLPGKMRFKDKNKKRHRLIISDGNTVWDYSSRSNAYTKKKYTFSQTRDDQIEKGLRKVKPVYSYVKNFVRAFNPLADSIEKISSLNRDTLMMPDSSRRGALKISVMYAHNSLPELSNGIKKFKKKHPSVSIKHIKLFPTTFWIDPKKNVVLRESFGGSFEIQRMFKKAIMMTMKTGIRKDIYYTSVNMHPNLADSLFVFQPPKKAKKVKKLHDLK
jgi:peroxiredoxin/outer membrane lipoprotein-sorting protein